MSGLLTSLTAAVPRLSAAGLAVMVINIGVQASMPFLALYGQNLGLSNGSIGLLISSQALVSMVVALPTGSWLSRSGARTVGIAGSLIMAVGYFWVWQDTSPRGLWSGLLLIGAAQTAIVMAGQVFVLLNEQQSRRGDALGMFFFASSLGATLGPLVGTLVTSTSSRIGDVFVVGFCTATISGILLYRSVAPLIPNHAVRWTDLGGLSSTLGKTSRFNLGGVAVSEMAVVAWNILAPLRLNEMGYPIEFVGALFALRGCTTMAVRPIFGTIVRRYHHPSVLGVTLLLIGSGLSLAAWPLTRMLGLLAATLYGAGVGVVFPITLLIITRGAIPPVTGKFIALRLLVARAAEALSPAILGVMAAASLGSALMVAAAVSGILGGYLMISSRLHTPPNLR
jgi:MFS family permease